MDIRILENGDKNYPYNRNQLKLDYPNTSFRDIITDDCAASYVVFPVSDVEIPDYDPSTQKITEQDPVKIDSEWQQVWKVSKLTKKEISENTNRSIQQVKTLLTSPTFPVNISLDGNNLIFTVVGIGSTTFTLA